MKRPERADTTSAGRREQPIRLYCGLVRRPACSVPNLVYIPPHELNFMYCLRTCLAIALLCPALVLAQSDDEQGFVPLFNGRDFTGWVRTNTPESTWSYQDGLIVCTGKPIGELRTEKMYQNFILEVEWRHMVPRGNAGIFLFADDITARGVPFHRGIEVQVLENAYGNTRGYTTHGDIFPIHGAKMVPLNGRGGDRAFPTENRSNPSPEWNHYRITAQDGEVTLAVNGKVVTRGQQCSPRKGYICLESEGGVVHYRNVKIKELPDTPVAEAEIAIANRGYYSIYTGLDLSGWTSDESARAAWVVRDWVLAHDGSTGESHSLVHEPVLEDFGFVIDFKLNQPESHFTLQLLNVAEADAGSGSKPDPISIYTTKNQDEKWLKPGQWYRLEGTVIGSVLTLAIDGHPLEHQHHLQRLNSKRQLTLTATGPQDLANLYLRPVEK
ncbi:MAG: DUF1080 domain-containing protein [Planctomycetaceae bacterium]|nr:DUF1080 domain-containing protein [Planctomycetaceae bacterium]